MTQTFSKRALALYSLAARFLGWRPAEFWGATPCELLDALDPPAAGTPSGVGRAELNRLMDTDNA